MQQVVAVVSKLQCHIALFGGWVSPPDNKQDGGWLIIFGSQPVMRITYKPRHIGDAGKATKKCIHFGRMMFVCNTFPRVSHG